MTDKEKTTKLKKQLQEGIEMLGALDEPERALHELIAHVHHICAMHGPVGQGQPSTTLSTFTCPRCGGTVNATYS